MTWFKIKIHALLSFPKVFPDKFSNESSKVCFVASTDEKQKRVKYKNICGLFYELQFEKRRVSLAAFLVKFQLLKNKEISNLPFGLMMQRNKHKSRKVGHTMT